MIELSEEEEEKSGGKERMRRECEGRKARQCKRRKKQSMHTRGDSDGDNRTEVRTVAETVVLGDAVFPIRHESTARRIEARATTRARITLEDGEDNQPVEQMKTQRNEGDEESRKQSLHSGKRENTSGTSAYK
jgi:hypothetical protein